MKNRITKVKNTLAGLSSRIRNAEDWISELQNGMVEITAMKKNKERLKRKEDLCHNIKHKTSTL